MTKMDVCSQRLFRLKHIGHTVVKANSSDGPSLICDTCDIANETPEQKAGSARNHPSLKSWMAFHEAHGGELFNPGGGTVGEYVCSECGGSW